jgi:hypothetical protein
LCAFLIIDGIWSTLSRSRSDQTYFNDTRKLTHLRSDSVHHECNSRQHYDSTVNKRMLTRPSIHCEEKFPKNPVQFLSSVHFMLYSWSGLPSWQWGNLRQQSWEALINYLRSTTNSRKRAPAWILIINYSWSYIANLHVCKGEFGNSP